MNNTLRALAFLLTWVLLLSACRSKGMLPTTTPPISTPTSGEVRLGANDNSGQVELYRGQDLVISLDGNPTTGYTWEVTEINAKVLRQVGKIEFQQESELLGASGMQILRFEAVGTGQTSLKLIYHRSWEKGVEPVKIFTLQVSVH